MLILTRKPGESLYIGDSIKITIVELKGHQIRVGIDAPAELRIYREEIYLQILEENKKAAEAAMSSDLGLESLSESMLSKGRSGPQNLASSGAKDDEDGEGDSEEGDPKDMSPRPSFSNFFTSRARDAGPKVLIKRKRARKSHE